MVAEAPKYLPEPSVAMLKMQKLVLMRRVAVTFVALVAAQSAATATEATLWDDAVGHEESRTR